MGFPHDLGLWIKACRFYKSLQHWQLPLDTYPSCHPSQLKGQRSLSLFWCHLQQGSPSPAQGGLGKWSLHTHTKNPPNKQETKKENPQSGRRDFLEFFPPPLFREETLHHMGSYREVSEEARLTFTAGHVPSLPPATAMNSSLLSSHS